MIEWNSQLVKDTMTLYAVIQLSKSSIYIKKTSSSCIDHFRDGVYNPVCDCWQKVSLARSDDNTNTDLQQSDAQTG